MTSVTDLNPCIAVLNSYDTLKHLYKHAAWAWVNRKSRYDETLSSNNFFLLAVNFTVCSTLGKMDRVKSCVLFSELLVEIRISMNTGRDSTSVSERVKEGSGNLD